jgi:hypothetical protein
MAYVVDIEVMIAVVFDTMVHDLIYMYGYDSQILFPDVFRYGVLLCNTACVGEGRHEYRWDSQGIIPRRRK